MTQQYFKVNDQVYSVSSVDRNKTINLDLNENLFGCAPEVLEALKHINEKWIRTYPQTNTFEQKYARTLGLEATQVLATNGADAGIELVIKSLQSDITIITPSPTFKMYEIIAEWYGIPVIRINYKSLNRFPSEEILREMKQPGRVLFMANPDSPVGRWLSPEEIAMIAEEASPNLVVVDETYYHFAGQSAVSLIKTYPNIIFLHSFSKAYGLAGLRLGAVIASSNIIELLKKWIKPFETNQMALIAGITALETDGYLKSMIRQVNKSKEKLSLAIKETGLETLNTCANFILIKAGIWAPKIVRELSKRKFMVKLIHYPPLLDGYIRIAAMPDSILNDFITAFHDSLEVIWRTSRNKFPRH